MDRWQRSGIPARAPVVLVALLVVVSSSALLIWSPLTTDQHRFAWLTSMSNILALVLAGWGTPAAMLTWARGQRPLSGRLEYAHRPAAGYGLVWWVSMDRTPTSDRGR